MKNNLSNLCFNWHTLDRPCDRECLVRVARLLIAIISGRVQINFHAKRQVRKRHSKSGQYQERLTKKDTVIGQKETA